MGYIVQSSANNTLPFGVYGAKKAAERAARLLCADLGPGAEVLVTNCYSGVVARYRKSAATGKVGKFAP